MAQRWVIKGSLDLTTFSELTVLAVFGRKKWTYSDEKSNFQKLVLYFKHKWYCEKLASSIECQNEVRQWKWTISFLKTEDWEKFDV